MQSPTSTGLKRYLPAIGTPAYHLMLSAVAIFILGPLGGISAAFMNFSIGFFVGGQVLAGILGSAVTLPYGPEGKHGANYMQTMAASVAGMCGMAVLIQARHWLGLPEIPGWQLAVFYGCIGMFGGGIGMLYTPVLVDRMQLSFPSGFAVANILRALTDPSLLRRSVAKLGGGMAIGYGVGLSTLKVAALGATGLSASTVGAGMIVGARIAVPALVVALIGHFVQPYLVTIGWLQAGEPFRKIGFIIALGTILGAALIDIVLILHEAFQRFRAKASVPVEPVEDWKRVNTWKLVLWTVVWGAAVVIAGHVIIGEPLRFLLVAVGLCFLFVLVNGISLGISDWNPISSAFVLTVFILAAMGLTSAGTGLMCASILLIACSVGGDMQQDRSTGWRLGTNRVTQFRYQMIGIIFGAIFAVVLANVFLKAYPVLKLDQFGHSIEGSQWQSAMTYKFVGALRGITESQPHVITALWLGISIGLATEVIRKLVKRSRRYQAWSQASATGKTTDFLFDAVVMPSPYASSFGGFVEIVTVLWWTGGGVFGSLFNVFSARRKSAADAEALPADMSTMSLSGGGLIAGDSLAALSVGVYGLLSTVL
ncbi:MAG: OPT/YSL family transporter [Opitutaceae bacterium]|nr:OPT/YSL family transporter [Opitutaceae bacterium]MBP9912012.1 OPT/YSL family transporter [Opitutaceae bacterium]